MNDYVKTLLTVIAVTKSVTELAIAIIRLRAAMNRKRDGGQEAE